MRLIKHYVELEAYLDNVLVCHMCQDLITNATLLSPCAHAICQGCQKNRIEYKDKCPECHSKVEKFIQPVKIIDQAIGKFREKKKCIREILRQDIIKNSL